jgi:hypothetical protein
MTGVAGAAAVRRIREFGMTDTCCIDKASSAKLSEAINSMFEWYRRAAVCYAYLVGVPDAGANHWRISSAFRRSGRDISHALKLFASITTQLASKSLSLKCYIYEAIAEHRGITCQTLGD